MLTSISETLKRTIEDILKKVKSGYFTLDCVFYSPLNQTVKVTPRYVNSVVHNQRFTENFTDEIQLTVELMAQEAITLLSNYQNLLCTLTYTRLDHRELQPIPDEPQIILTYRVAIANAGDLLKQYTKSAILPSENGFTPESVHSRTISLNVQLIEKDVYDLRKKQVNGLLRNVTVEQAIYFVLNSLGIKNIRMVPPHNKKVWSKIDIPPMQDITTVFDFLQKNYGVYSKGLAYYYTQGIFYLYPAYETSSDKRIQKEVTHIYNVPSTSYAGMHGYHFVDGDVTHLVNNADVSTRDMATVGAELFGNYRLTMRTDTSLDLGRKVSGKSGKFSDDNVLGCGSRANRGMVNQSQGARYETASNNAYVMASEMAEYDCTLAASSWQMAELYSLKPGERVYYHFDGESVHDATEGVVDSVRYVTQISDRKSKYIYTIGAAYGLRLAPENI